MSLSSRLRRSRRAAVLSQAELAERMGVTTRTIQNWEAGLVPKKHSDRRALLEFIAEQEAAA